MTHPQLTPSQCLLTSLNHSYPSPFDLAVFPCFYRNVMELWQSSLALWLHICSSDAPLDYIQPITLKVIHKSVEHAVHQVTPLGPILIY